MRMAVVKIKHVVEKFSMNCEFSHVFMEREGECLCFIDLQNICSLFVFAVVGFSKCKSLYLNEREKCYGRQMYAFNPHKMAKKFVIRRNV
jgi:hypothetical protein